ncbi:MAG: hypothetical protein KGI38_11135 [Thaumarchaeota archaeon]|nr:hypothetical protein [Nitrososphaerota archaeon]
MKLRGPSLQVSYDYQLAYLHGLPRGILGELAGNTVKISMPSIIDSFASNLVDEVMELLNVVILHELSHWADAKDYGKDFKHSSKWNPVIFGLL